MKNQLRFIAALKAFAGQPAAVGQPSSSISPPSIRSATSCDRQWIHMDPVRAAAESRSAPPLPAACSRFR